MLKTISSKSEFFEKSRKLEMGNRLNQWTFDEFYELFTNKPEKLPELIGIRSAFTKNAKITGLYPPHRALLLALNNHPDSRKWLFDEGAPNEYGRLIGEIMPDERGVYLRYTDNPNYSKIHMRRLFEADLDTSPGCRIWQHARGLRASAILQKYMDAASLDFVYETMATYEFPVIEFLTCSRPCGVLRWNTIIWEIRTHY